MNFLTKINRQYFFTLSLLLIIISIIGYYVLQAILINEIKEDIFEKEFAISTEIKEQGNLPNIYPIIETKKVSKSNIKAKAYTKVYLIDEAENEEEPYLEYCNTLKINDEYYLIKLRHSLLETNDLIIAIALPLLVLLALAFFVSFLFTKKLNKTIWQDFEYNLIKIEKYSFKKNQEFSLKQTGIHEFDRLNKTIKNLTRKLQKDYQSLKQFSENASHELQTPLSIILLNLEELLQNELPQKAFEQVISAINSVKRLSVLNSNLILLTKIDNHQFDNDNDLLINDIISNKIHEFTPLIKQQKLTIIYNQEGKMVLNIDKELIDILINNLLSNAIKHNIPKGKIEISIKSKELSICNSSKKNSLDNETIFNRFTKENSQSFGLGLAIVKQICKNNKLQIRYNKGSLHCFVLSDAHIV